MHRTNKPESLVGYLERTIETAIARGEFPPEARLSPTALAEEFEVSHIPVREALSSLAAKGYIDHKQSRGYFTRRLSSEEIADIYHWREVLEAEALKLAFPRITADDIDEMRAILDEEAAFTDAQRRFEYIRTNRKFHFVAYKRAGSPVLLHLLNYLWDISRPYLAAELVDSTRGHTDHIRQVGIFETGTVDELLQAMNDHRAFRIAIIKNMEDRR